MRLTILGLCVLSACALALAGCDDDSGGGNSLDLAGQWELDVASQDGYVAFQNTSLVITTNSGNSYTVAWMSSNPNGYAMLDTNTMTVTITAERPPSTLSLSGTLIGGDAMRGNGTIGGYSGLRVAVWEATR